MNVSRPLSSLALSTALVSLMATVVIVGTSPAHAAPMHVTVHAAPSAAQLRQLAVQVQGSYTLADGRELAVWREAGTMKAQIGDAPAMALRPEGALQLVSADGRTRLQFQPGSDGRAMAVSLQLSPAPAR